MVPTPADAFDSVESEPVLVPAWGFSERDQWQRLAAAASPRWEGYSFWEAHVRPLAVDARRVRRDVEGRYPPPPLRCVNVGP